MKQTRKLKLTNSLATLAPQYQQSTPTIAKATPHRNTLQRYLKDWPHIKTFNRLSIKNPGLATRMVVLTYEILTSFI